MIPLRHTLPTLVFAAALISACGGGEDQAASGPVFPAETLNACALFTPEDAMGLVKKAVSPMSSTLNDAESGGSQNPLVCAYNSGRSDAPRVFSLEVRPARSAGEARRRFDSGQSYLKTLGGKELQTVPGLGDEALWVGGTVQQMHVLKDNLHLVITAETENLPKSLYVGKVIAQRALARLDQMAAASKAS